MMESQHRMITRPLQHCGATVDVFLSQDLRGCANSTLHQRLVRWHGKHVRTSQVVVARTQGQNLHRTLQFFGQFAAEYDAMILTRYDLRLLRPIGEWPGCHDTSTVGVASRCEAEQWKNWNCTNDILFVVPRSHLWAFNASVGAAVRPEDSRYFSVRRRKAKVNPSACFATSGETVSPGVPKGLGHGCYNSLAARIGYEQLSFCWASQATVTEPNDFYQCCRHGTMHGVLEREVEASMHNRSTHHELHISVEPSSRPLI